METRTYSPGETILQEGEPSDYAYIIRKGRVEVVREHLGQTVQLNSLGRGEIFGELGVIDAQPRSATVRAVEPVTLSVLSNDEIVEMIYDDPEKSLVLIRSAFDRIRNMYAEKEQPNGDIGGDLDAFRSEMSKAIAQAIRDHEEGVMKSHVGILPIVAALLITALVGGSVFFKAQIMSFVQALMG